LGKYLPLVNKHGLCLAVTGGINPGKMDAKIIQSDCNPSEKGQLWKQNGDHLCNELNKCISTPLQRKPGSRAPYVIHLDLSHQDKRQEFRGTNESTIRNIDYCLGIKDDANCPGAEAKTDICNSKENGQTWNFVETEFEQEKVNVTPNFKTTKSNIKNLTDQSSNSYLSTTKTASFHPRPVIFQTKTTKGKTSY